MGMDTRARWIEMSFWVNELSTRFYTIAMGEPRQVEAGPSDPTPTIPDGFEKWRTNLSHFTGLGLTDEQKAERELSKANGNLAKDWDRCEKWKKELLESSATFLLL
jgi:inner membrane protease ATP23